MPNADFNNILTTTLDRHRTSFQDAVFTARPLTYWLMKAGNLDMVSGGDTIVEPLVYAENTTAGSYENDDILDTSDVEILSASRWEWAQTAVAVRMTGLDAAKNSGPEAILNLMSAKVQVAEESAKALFNRMFHADGTGNAGKDWNGLRNLIVPITGTIGGIDSNAHTYWRPARVDNDAEAISLADMNTCFNSAAQGNDAPDLILTTQALYEKYEALLQPNMRYEDKTAAEGSFQSLVYKGRPIVYDRDTAADHVYFLNSKYLKLKGHSSNWFRNTPFDTPPNQDISTSLILCYGQLVVTNRRMHSVMTAKT